MPEAGVGHFKQSPSSLWFLSDFIDTGKNLLYYLGMGSVLHINIELDLYIHH